MVKNIEHPKRTISSLKKGDEHSRHFQRRFPPVPQPWRPSLAARWCQGQRARIRHFHFSGCKLLILLRITIWAEEFFHGGVDLNPLSTVRSPQSTVVCCAVWCLLFNVVGEPLTRLVKIYFLLVSRVVIAMFWKAKISFSLVKNIVFRRLQNMDLVWTQKWRKIFYLKMNRNISRGSNMLTQLRSLGSVLKDIPQFFVQVSNFDMNC